MLTFGESGRRLYEEFLYNSCNFSLPEITEIERGKDLPTSPWPSGWTFSNPLKHIGLSAGHWTTVVTEGVLRASGFYMLGFYQWPWWLLAIKMQLMWKLPVLQRICRKPFFSSHTQYDLELEGPYMFNPSFYHVITSSLIARDRWIQVRLNNFGE